MCRQMRGGSRRDKLYGKQLTRVGVTAVTKVRRRFDNGTSLPAHWTRFSQSDQPQRTYIYTIAEVNNIMQQQAAADRYPAGHVFWSRIE